jgi:hypothetical protein
VQATVPPDGRLPGARSREHDAIALIDEGGAVVFEADEGHTSSVVIFGHALYESLVLGRGPVTACGVRIRAKTLPPRIEQVTLAEDALLEILARRDLHPSHLARVPIPPSPAAR